MDDINPYYAKKEVVKEIKKAFLKDKNIPSVALHDFLTKEGLSKARKQASKWKHASILDQFSYATSPARLGITAFVKAATGKTPLQHPSMLFKHGDFTLLHDHDTQKAGVLGLYFLFDWDPAWGGELVFVKDGETLGRFAPSKNTLLLVWRKKGVQSFIKYVNHKAGKNVLVFLSVA